VGGRGEDQPIIIIIIPNVQCSRIYCSLRGTMVIFVTQLVASLLSVSSVVPGWAVSD